MDGPVMARPILAAGRVGIGELFWGLASCFVMNPPNMDEGWVDWYSDLAYLIPF